MIVIYNGKKGHNGPQATTQRELGVGLHIEVVTVNGWYAVEGGGCYGIEETSVQSVEEMVNKTKKTRPKHDADVYFDRLSWLRKFATKSRVQL